MSVIRVFVGIAYICNPRLNRKGARICSNYAIINYKTTYTHLHILRVSYSVDNVYVAFSCISILHLCICLVLCYDYDCYADYYRKGVTVVCTIIQGQPPKKCDT